MKILHITNWFPNRRNPKESLWIRNHIKALTGEENDIIHFEIKFGSLLKRDHFKEKNLEQIITYFPFRVWFLVELLYFFWLYYQFKIKKIHKKYDVVNFHIAYPMLSYWHCIKKGVNKPVVISEHWSAYHFNFGVNKSLPRVQRIFRHKIPVITVSQALANDIKRFAGEEFETFIVPNVVDNKIFYCDESVPREDFFFMVSQWKTPKNPLAVMEAFIEFNVSQRYVLKIGGYGPQWKGMEKWIDVHKVHDQIDMIGPLQSEQVAGYMRRCKAFLHPSEYETFSVVCAEALTCGAYVIAPRIGGIPEIVNGFGMLLESSNKREWMNALRICDNSAYVKTTTSFAYSSERVGQAYRAALKSVICAYHDKVNHTGVTFKIR